MSRFAQDHSQRQRLFLGSSTPDFVRHVDTGRSGPTGFAVHLSIDLGDGPAIAGLCIEDENLGRVLNSSVINASSRLALSTSIRMSLDQAHESVHARNTVDSSTIRAVVARRARQYADWEAKADLRWREIEALDQVFIAI
ncbi:hypothetical protein [Streptosporangium sp. NPDC048865]|uniref:hypothetical protein n=1 Tax=Streptosporangium sp. NPDC048865 TaxID=3155766 RepID=UPI00343A9F50